MYYTYLEALYLREDTMWPWRKNKNDKTYDEYVETKPFERLTPMTENLVPEWDAHVVMMQAAWGEVIRVLFVPEEWHMLHQVAEISGKDLETVIGEVVTDRYLNQNL